MNPTKAFKATSMAVLLCFLLMFPGWILPEAGPQTTPAGYTDLLNSIKMRNIGSAVMGGRTVDFAVVESNTAIVYAAIGPSGLWKSTDNGMHWAPVFDSQGSVSIGSVEVSRSNPDIVWVGTGESTCRNSVAIGDGVYKSEDGGKTWTHKGLTETRHVDRILIDPTNPDIVYVGAMGHLWGPNKERGVFKTTDGGKTWRKTLYFDENTGIAEMVMDPANNHIIYAAAYNHRRNPFYYNSGGPNSGLYKSTDSGETWKQLKNGLPEGTNGRIGISVCRTKPEVVYTIIENKDGGIFRSDDKGESWTRMCDKKTYDQVNFRPFYYSKINVDPNNDRIIYAYSGKAYVSEDGGKTFTQIARSAHADHHRIWINPFNSNHIIDGNDGGIDISFDRGKTWHPIENGSWAEVYQLGVDMRDPYYVYMGLQDNGNWAGPSNSKDRKGILNHHWYPTGDGDGFYIQVDPRDHNYIYRNLQMGEIQRFVQSTGQVIGIKPFPGIDEEPYRFNWNSPIYLSQHDPDTIYFGGNFLFKSTNRGDSWEKISPDLTTNDPKKIIDSGGEISTDNTGAEAHCTIYTITESPVKKGLLWVGTDDGNLWITKDSGKNWENVVKNIKGLPAFSWVSRVEASHFAEGTVYVTFDRHNSDDYAPYVYKSTDYGKTWISLQSNLPKTGYLFVIREDPVNSNLLYLGSEFGLFFSFNGGQEWLAYKNGFPTAAVRDIVIHPREKDLIVGTHGRGVWILDDLTPLEQATPSVMANEITLFDIRPATIYFNRSSGDLNADTIFSAPNPTFGAGIAYWMKNKAPENQKVSIHIYDPEGNKVRTIEGTGEKGFNRIYWDLHDKPVFDKTPDFLKGEMFEWLGLPLGPFVLPGQYKVVLEFGKNKLEKTVEVKKDKELAYPIEEWKENRKTVQKLNGMLKSGLGVIFGLRAIETDLNELDKKLKSIEKVPETVTKKLAEIREKLNKIKQVLAVTALDSGYYRRPLKTALKGGDIPEQILMLQFEINNFPGKPTETQKQHIDEMLKKALPMIQMGLSVITGDIPELNKILREANIDYIKVPKLGE